MSTAPDRPTPRPRRRKYLIAIACLTVFVAIIGTVYYYLHSPFTGGPMIQMVGPTGFTVVWQTDLPGSGRLVVKLGDQTVADVSAVKENGQYAASVTGLRPGQTYRYEVYDRFGGVSALLGSWSCKTDAGPTAPVRLLVFGDSGTGSFSQYQLGKRMMEYPFDLILHTGDLVYFDGAPECYPANFFEPYRRMLPSTMFVPVLGNHDLRTRDGEPFLSTFVLPRNGPAGLQPERHFWFDFGCARFVGIDGMAKDAELTGQVAPWLKEVFSSAGRQWRFVFCHYPPYTGTEKRDPDIRLRTLLVPAMEAAGVDMMLLGHNHLYERTHPLRSETVVDDSKGIVYIVTGAGGARLYEEKPVSSRPAYIAAFFDQDLSFTLLDVSPDNLKLRQIDLGGHVVDQWELRRGPRATLGPTTTSRP